MEKKEIIQLLSDFSTSDGDNYEQRSIRDNDFDSLADAILIEMKRFSNSKIDEIEQNIDWNNCYERGDYCGTDGYEKFILSFKELLK